MSFTHLHVHSYYSLMDGLNSPADLVKAAKDAGQTALAITDHGTLSSHREMQIACKEQGIKPILGVEAYISPTDRFDRSSKTDKSIFEIFFAIKGPQFFRVKSTIYIQS